MKTMPRSAAHARDVVIDPARREFLASAAATSGGLLIAIHLPACTDRPQDAAPGAAGTLANPTSPVQANAWLRIDIDGAIVFLSDRSEMGQGVYTALPTLLAEELEVPVETIRVESAPPGDAYINGLLGLQVTGGSTSVREAWEKLRRAGAEARTRLVAAAAAHWGIDAAQLRAENGAVIAPDGARLRYGQLATAAAALPAPADVTLKPESAFTQVGKPRQRLDTPAKVDGTAVFGIDVRVPGMLYGAIAVSPVLGGRVRTFDAARARAMPDVREVLQVSTGVVVLADSWWQARQARDAVTVEWDPGAAASVSSASIRDGLRAALEQRSAEAQVARNDGDADAALAQAGSRIQAVYELPLLAHATLEPQNCTVELVGDAIHVHVPTQVQERAQAAAAAAVGVGTDKVFVHTTHLGGGFGRRLEVDFIPAAVEAAVASGRSVKLLWTREDDTTHDYYRPPAYDRCTAALDANGKPAAWKLEICAPSVTGRWAPAVLEQTIDPFSLEAAANYPYDVPSVRVTYLRHEIGIDVGYWRSVSHATNCFVVESFMDELAHAAQADPFEFRRDLLMRQPEARWREALERGAERARWGRAPEGRFQGIALMEGYGSFLAMVAEIAIQDGKVRVEKITCSVDCGRMVNPAIVESQVQSSIVFGLSAALWGDVTLDGGQVRERNYDTFRILRMNEVPEIDIELVASEAAPGGIGEPATALVAPAVGNAIFAATGQRIRALPFARHGLA